MKNHRTHSAAPSGHTPEPLGLKRRHFMGTALALDAAALLAACGGGGGGGDSGSTNTSGSSSGSSSTSSSTSSSASSSSSGSSSSSASSSVSSSASSSGSSSGSGSGSGSAAPTYPWVVTTLAGTGAIYPLTNGTAATATFSSPYGIAIDTNGNIYLADYNNNRIRKINPAGVVSTLAGSGALSAVDGSGATATFSYAYGVAVDTSGHVYVADYFNHMIRKITSEGVVSTLAGSGGIAGSANGAGTVASFRFPTSVAVDTSGYVYVGDTLNHLIRKISPVGVVSTLAGTGGIAGSANGTGTVASFNNPSGLAIDNNGNLYVSDTGNHLIRKITTSGVVSTLAGTGFAGSANGTGIMASFHNPTSAVIDNSNNIYVVDQLNHRIRKITPSSVVSTVAGDGTLGYADGPGDMAKFSSPNSITVDNSGNLYVTDSDNHRIRKITPIF
ncbi:MAG: hypothetical protein RLZZ123_2552 [Pseudomonadota bacterium]|jgi:sugar lactone lactonase YvrE